MTKRLQLALAASLLLFTLLAGCKAPECRQMLECCEAVKDMPGVGPHCGGLASDVRDPTTCRSITQTVSYMFEARETPVPEACQ